MFNLSEISNIIRQSHLRCENEYKIPKGRVFPLKIVKGLEFQRLCKKNYEVIKVARPFMEILYDFLRGSGFFLDLTDKDGVILIAIGDRDVIEEAKKMKMIEGSDMSEKSTGTNAIGTSIYMDQPMQMAEKQHYLNAYHIWTCSADTIHDKYGNVIGCLNLTGKYQLVHPHTLGLVVAAVKSIENYIEMEKSQNKLFEAYQYLDTIINSMDVGILTVDSYGKIKSINVVACKMLQVNKDSVISSNISNLIENWEHIYEQMDNYKYENNDYTVYLNKKNFNLNVSPIKDKNNRILSIIVMLKDIQKVYNMVNKYTGMRAKYSFSDIIGKSSAVTRMKRYAKSISDSPSTVLIEGESGTGKELIAQAIHNDSSRRNYGFIAINCGAIPKNLIESELFGYEEGTFTGAKKGGQLGKFELANNGTIFLDEIGEMPLDMQINLLRVLQEGCIMRIGGSRYIKINVRIIAATNKNLKEEIAEGNFREDLYYRLCVIPIHVPPLKEREGDIKLLIDYFLKLKSSKLKKETPCIKPSLYSKLLNYDWPGNVRELENCIENIVNMNGKTSFDFDKHISNNNYENTKLKYEYNMCSLNQWEKVAIIDCIKKCSGNLSRASKILGINRTTLYNKINKYDIKI
ncbi:MAG: sigma 54-interacting transcriptional regulator [Clostridium sp.]|jgi:PAS domain S-box-containing protein|uniref:sigma-54-dependent Fis family transcriptional regulator n=1 Tax=Clostridium sp. TaxID=1506 RepID=UPI0025BF76C6|nr:sigma 54-interacting transcriptional regulator [Clostridium sp.]MCH3965785.1 sigma 54-interacting transcriptional regulator [Clostridium sp.]MCI1717323.1 sigma 54-interacting transcriptional regulator [Clostridium sp.]MCI1801663.1 sigma 54-interacting transcriptional regulator [Clostridium sp.]MCI1815509.1 sigma 54-interacting transcriptional regulator [Clostridium sp.]MCI1872392.1 sigma 54-interacting transcriptional regulator [Clostridium sp.]